MEQHHVYIGKLLLEAKKYIIILRCTEIRLQQNLIQKSLIYRTNVLPNVPGNGENQKTILGKPKYRQSWNNNYLSKLKCQSSTESTKWEQEITLIKKRSSYYETTTTNRANQFKKKWLIWLQKWRKQKTYSTSSMKTN